MSDDIAFLPAVELAERFASRSLSPVEVIEAVLHRIDTFDPEINSYRIVDAPGARAAAAASEERWRAGKPLGPLDGIPISVKDNLMVKGQAFRRGSLATPDTPATQNSPIVDRLVEGGCVIVGMTTTPEFAAGLVTDSPLTGLTRNPWNLDTHAGGSSGGAAASVAAGLCSIGLGTDAGGSIRLPAAFCGVVGMKPTGGSIPTFPSSVAGILSSAGPLTRSAKDVLAIYPLIAQRDIRDPDVVPLCMTGWPEIGSDSGDLRGLRIAVTTTLGYAQRVDPEIRSLTEAAGQHLATLGATVEEACPPIDNPIDTFATLFRPGLTHALSSLAEPQRRLVGAALRAASEEGGKVNLSDYLRAQERRKELARTLHAFHENYDLLVTPTVSVPAFPADLSGPKAFEDLTDTRAWNAFCYPFNLTLQPAISVPNGFTGSGLPIGLQIVGPRFADGTVLRAALAYEATRPVLGRPPL